MGRTRPSDSGSLPSAARRHATLMGLATPAAHSDRHMRVTSRCCYDWAPVCVSTKPSCC